MLVCAAPQVNSCIRGLAVRDAGISAVCADIPQALDAIREHLASTSWGMDTDFVHRTEIVIPRSLLCMVPAARSVCARIEWGPHWRETWGP